MHHKTDPTIQHLAEARLNPVFCTLTHAFLLQDITVITSFLGRRLSSIEEDMTVETVDMFYKDIGLKEISLPVIVNTNMNALYGLSNVIWGDKDKNFMKT